MPKGTLRRHNRLEVRAPIQLIWKDRNGNDKFTYAYTLDVSESGLRAEVPEPLPERSYVTFRAESLALQGAASVRSCHRQGLKHVVGLEFSGGMKWRPKPGTIPDVKQLAEALQEPAPPSEKVDTPVPR